MIEIVETWISEEMYQANESTLNGGIIVMICGWSERAFIGREIFCINSARFASCSIEFPHEYLEASLEQQSGLRAIGAFGSLIKQQSSGIECPSHDWQKLGDETFDSV